MGSLAGERTTIAAVLAESEGNRTRAAEILGMGRATLWRKLKQYGLEDHSTAGPPER